MKLGIMQPYFFPYIGYFQLINLVDKYVIYDDVDYIKGGWINRNRILLNNKSFLLNINMVGASPNKKINEIEVNIQRNKLERTITQAYRKAPFYDQTFAIIEEIVACEEKNLARFIANSLIKISKTLGIETEFIVSSAIDKNNELRGQNKVIDICKTVGATAYYNAIGGTELYDKEVFKKDNIDLFFVKTQAITYQQFANEFVPNLSIIDVMMFNSPEQIKIMLDRYELI